MTLTDAHGKPHTFEIGPINLDGYTTDPGKLMSWWFVVKTHPVKVARALFPDRPKGYVRATRLLASYAANKSAAMYCRLQGKVDTALRTYEPICDGIYDELPEFARW